MKEHICEVCGRASFQKLKADGKIVCWKHKNQFKKYGKFLDNNPRNKNDLNEIRADGDTAYMDLYDIYGNVKATTTFDREDIPKVQFKKWHILNNGYVYSKLKFTGDTKLFHKVILNVEEMVDHIDGDKLNNRKSNLRICNKSSNAMNRKDVVGVTKLANGKYKARIKKDGKQIHLGTYVYFNEALWARWFAERVVFKEFAKQSEEPFILDSRKKDITDYILPKVQRL